MKKRLIVASMTLGILALVGTVAYAGTTPGSGIYDTVHDLSGARGDNYGGADHQDRVCIWCHAPHHTLDLSDAPTYDYLPLWNHEVSTYASFDTYNAGDGQPDDDAGHYSTSTDLLSTGDQPGSVSRLCLSCHDGTVAVNAYGTAADARTTSRGAGDTDIQDVGLNYRIGAGGSLANHHPIGFDYDTVADVDDEIADVDTLIGAQDASNWQQIGDLLYGGQMECVTCHDVHNTKNKGETLLWESDVHSAFCCTCHLKCE